MNQLYFDQPDSFSARFMQISNDVIVEGNDAVLFPMPVFRHQIDKMYQQKFENIYKPCFISNINDFKINISPEQAIQILLNYFKDHNTTNNGGEYRMYLDKNTNTLSYSFKMKKLISDYHIDAKTGKLFIPEPEVLTSSDE